MTETVTHLKTMGRKDMVLFTVSAIMLLDTLSSSASIGVSSITWWVLLGLFFFVPFALICAEMGCTYPQQGGIYAWIKRAYGSRWASRASWYYWVNTAVWIPAIYILFAGIFKQLFIPDLSMFAQIAIAIVLTWVAVFVNIVTLNIGKWVPNMGAIFKIVIFITIIVGAIFHTMESGVANEFSFSEMMPSWNASTQFIPAIIYGMLGFELVSASSAEMKDPSRDVPRAIFISGLIIIVLYTLATAAILIAIPVEEINLVEGLMDTLLLFFGSSQLGIMFAYALGIAALYTFFSNGVTWAIGCNRAAAEAALDGELPAVFGIETKHRGTPIGASIAMGIVATLALVLFGFMSGSNEDLFWSLFAFSAVIFMIPYLGMILAFVKLRIHDSETPRPFAVPGNHFVAQIVASVCFIILSFCIVLFVYTPGEGTQWPVLIGAGTMIILGEIVILMTEKQS